MPFWSDAQLASIDRMLNPRSIAVVGATPRMQYGGRFLAAAMGSMERGVNVYPVNPRYEEVQGLQAYPSVSALPEAPDVVGIVVPYHAVLDTLRESHEKGARSAIVISAGFAERGVDDRRDLQGELGQFAQESGMRVSGPNCLGLANLKDDIWASASSRGASGLSGPIGLVCQSGASAFGPFLNRAADEGIGFTYIVSTGNEARPGLLRLRAVPAGRRRHQGDRGIRRGVQGRAQVRGGGEAGGGTGQAHRADQDRAVGVGHACRRVAHGGADGGG